MKEYNEEKLKEIVKEIFNVCLEKNIFININPICKSVSIHFGNPIKEGVLTSYYSIELFNYTYLNTITVEELLKKVKVC